MLHIQPIGDVTMNRLICMLLLAMVMTACSTEQDATQEQSTEPAVSAENAVIETDPVDGIGWFDGSVDEAFAAAQESGKPIYLYWGAEWCPPCHAISATSIAETKALSPRRPTRHNI
jgi:protein disulfide-isomerase